jgi:hypothetical protein
MASTWNADNCFTEPELRKLSVQGDIRAVTIQETMDGYIVVVKAHLPVKKGDKWVSGAVDGVWRTRREAAEPRVFNSLERLMDRLSSTFPHMETVQVDLLPEKLRKKKMLEQQQRRAAAVDEKTGEKKAGRPKKTAKVVSKLNAKAGTERSKPAKKATGKKAVR